ncbi:MAG: serine/threonine protein kinase [Labilithrix sp.]|nr:serine/threonine protein kinase [Labilithrix sp.]
MKLEVGQVFSGTLRLVRKIADGGMGSVWIAEHLVLGTEVAVKFMSGPWAAVPSARSRFLREARMTANIDSPHVVRVLDCRHNEADEPYLVLELLHGENLEQRVRRHGALSVFEVVEIVAQTCEALAATHDAGIVHRDLKPENVFLVAGPTTFVKLLDYGVAKPMNKEQCLDVDRLPAGTPQYMSPEHMFEPETTDARSDLFSLAAVAYFALTRRTPFDAESIEGLYFAIDGGTFARPSELRPELPAALDRWFEKALAHDPKNRFANARQMADALYDAAREAHTLVAETTAAADEAPASTRQPTLSELVVPLRRMRRSRKSAIAALVLAAMTSLFVWRSTGPELQEANASTTSETSDARSDARPLAPAPIGPEKTAAVEPEAPSAPAPAEPAPAPAPAVHAHNAIHAAARGTMTITSESEASKLLEGDPAQLAPAIEGLVGGTPKAATPAVPAGDLAVTGDGER